MGSLQFLNHFPVAMRLVQSLSRFWVKRQVRRVAQQRWDGVTLIPPTAYVPNPALERALRTHMSAFEVGVHVLCMPPDSGKTTATARVLQAMVRDPRSQVTGVVPLRCGAQPPHGQRMPIGADENAQKTIVDVMHETLGTAGRELLPWDSFPKGTVIVVDDVEEVAKTDHHMEWLETHVKALAHEGVERKNITTIILVRNPVLASTMVSWNGGRKIRPVKPEEGDPSFEFLPEQQDALIRQLSAFHERTPEFQAEIARWARRAPVPGFIVASCALGGVDTTIVSSIEDAWVSWKKFMQLQPTAGEK